MGMILILSNNLTIYWYCLGVFFNGIFLFQQILCIVLHAKRILVLTKGICVLYSAPGWSKFSSHCIHIRLLRSLSPPSSVSSFFSMLPSTLTQDHHLPHLTHLCKKVLPFLFLSHTNSPALQLFHRQQLLPHAPFRDWETIAGEGTGLGDLLLPGRTHSWCWEHGAADAGSSYPPTSRSCKPGSLGGRGREGLQDMDHTCCPNSSPPPLRKGSRLQRWILLGPTPPVTCLLGSTTMCS